MTSSGAYAELAEPRAPARTSDGASPVFITIERVNPAERVSGSIWATYPGLRWLSNANRCRFALGLRSQALWIERVPPRIARTKYEGLDHASAMTADAPARMKPAA